MKRRELIRRLEEAGCELVRHGANHDIYRNPANGRQTAVPRHGEIDDTLYRMICKQLGIVPT